MAKESLHDAWRQRPITDRSVWILAVVFGVASVAWTYGFEEVLRLPLWPSFIAAATYFAAGGRAQGFGLAVASTLSGVAYGAATLWVVELVAPGSLIALSVAVGVAMLVASLHPMVRGLSFGPGVFFGYAAMFSVDAAGSGFYGTSGLSGAALATGASMVIGALIGWGADTARVMIQSGAMAAPETRP